MLHPDTELRWVDERIGVGVFATRPIPTGTILWALDDLDQRLSPAAAIGLGAVLGPLVERYTFRNGRGEHVLCWDHGRFMNHSCRPASLSPGVDYELAVRDLAAGDEITCDYGALNLERAFECACGWRACRGVVRPDDWDRMVPAWDAALQKAVRFASEVEQPLLPCLTHPQQLRAWARRPEALPSTARHRLVRGAVEMDLHA